MLHPLSCCAVSPYLAARSFQRGLKRKALALIKKLRKAKKEAASGEKPDAVRAGLGGCRLQAAASQVAWLSSGWLAGRISMVPAVAHAVAAWQAPSLMSCWRGVSPGSTSSSGTQSGSGSGVAGTQRQPPGAPKSLWTARVAGPAACQPTAMAASEMQHSGTIPLLQWVQLERGTSNPGPAAPSGSCAFNAACSLARQRDGRSHGVATACRPLTKATASSSSSCAAAQTALR